MNKPLGFLRRLIGRNRIILSIVIGSIFLYLATPTRTAILTGVPFILLGETIRTWASGFIKKDRELAQGGPYAFTRNPLYLGNFLIGVGFSIMANNIALFVLFLTTFSIVYGFTIKNEEKSLLAKFGDSYIAYKSRVPAFFPIRIIPLFPPLKKGGEGGFARWRNFSLNFDWHLVKRHREHHTWLGIAGCLMVFILKVSLSP